jgi:hypothetical protein
VNSALVAAPFDPQTGIPQSALFELFFNNMGVLNQVADHDDKMGKHTQADGWRRYDQEGAGLNDAEGDILREIVLDCLSALKQHDAKFRAAADRFRAQLKPGAPVQIPAELVQMGEDREKILNDHIEKLKEALGDASFNKLDNYIHSSFHVEVVQPGPKPSPKAGESRKENK